MLNSPVNTQLGLLEFVTSVKIQLLFESRTKYNSLQFEASQEKNKS